MASSSPPEKAEELRVRRPQFGPIDADLAQSAAGIEEFPNIEAVQKYMAAVNELNLFRYVESTNVLGTKLES